jgi:predicted ATPase/class 3 adenylate cyclase/Tfp pilus assembly protein PilF
VPEQQTGIATFLFTDVEGSTRLWEADPPAMADALAHHDAVLRAAIAEAGGTVFKTAGDAFCAVFAVPAQAIASAVTAQRALSTPAAPGLPALRVRMAIHAGHAEARDGDYFGPPLNRVARLLAVAHGGQILVSRAAGELARDDLPPDLALRDLGEFALRDLQHPERVLQVVGPGLAAEFPPLRTPERLLRNVPRPATPLIGREREIAFARAVLTPGQETGAADGEPNGPPRAALLTLTGPGGAGKTRLALHLAAEIGVELADGAVFAPLAEIGDPALVPAAVAAALELGDEGGQGVRDHIVDWLRGRELLLVLDNFEQVTGAAPFVADLLQFCPRLRIIVTSRERLQVRGEQELPLPPLALPAAPATGAEREEVGADTLIDEIRQSAAVRLFVARAQSVKPGFETTAENAVAIADIVRRLDGLPLAIELAAARARSLSPQALRDRLDRQLDLLNRGPRDLPARQQTMRDTIAWSYDLLDLTEQRLFARVSIFTGGADLSAAEAVAADDLVDAADVFDLLEALADKSLLRLADGGEEPRFEMLQTIREFGLERLRESSDEETVARRHADYFLALAESCEPLLIGAGQTRCLDRLHAERANLRAAAAWFHARGAVEEALRLGGALWRFWWLRGDMGEGLPLLESLLAEGTEVRPAVLAKALNGAGVLADSHGDWETATHLHEQGLAISRELSDLPGVAWALNNLGVVAINQGDFGRARHLLEENLAVAESVGDHASIATALIDLGQVVFHEADYDRAGALWTRSLALFRELGDESHLARCLNNLGFMAGQRGDLAAARALLTESLVHHRSVGDWQGISGTLNNLAAIANDTGDPETAGRLYRESYALALEGGNQLYAAIALENLAAWTLQHGAPDTARARFGEALTMYRAVGDLQGISTCLCRLTEFAASAGQHRDAATMLGAVSRYQDHHPALAVPELDETAELLRQALGDETFTACWETGRGIAIDDVVRLATAGGIATAGHAVG